MTRTGKIARLPRDVRDQLNRRLENGEPGKQVVAWLNGLPEVREVMVVYFDGMPISEQNLSLWKQGGFLEWRRQEESLEWVRQFTEQADDFADEVGPVPIPLSDRLSGLMALTLARLLAQAAAKPLEEESVRREIFVLSRELALLRHADHEAARLKMKLEIHTRQEEDLARHREQWEPMNHFMKSIAMNDAFRDLTAHMPEKFVEEMRIILNLSRPPLRSRKEGDSSPEPKPDPTQSN